MNDRASQHLTLLVTRKVHAITLFNIANSCMRNISLLFMSILLTVGCTEEVNVSEKKGGIAGIVADKTTGEPVSVVNIKIKETGASAVTGSDGSFLFKELSEGTPAYIERGFVVGDIEMPTKETALTYNDSFFFLDFNNGNYGFAKETKIDLKARCVRTL